MNQNGIIQANSVREQNGIIELIASDSLTLGANSQILAQGDGSSASSSGGTVTLKSDKNFSDTVGSKIITAGGALGGNGGDVEVSAPNILSLDSHMDASAQSGWNGGTFFLDPVNIILGTSTAGGAINVNTAFAGFSSIILQASANITVNAGTVWNLSGRTGVQAGQLTLQAGGNILLNDGAKIFDANNWAVTLQAGYNFVNNTVSAGTGSISFNGKASIQTATGAINLTAKQNIDAGSGFIITTGGGSITAQALLGNINTGSFAQGYTFHNAASSLAKAYDLSGGLGGISTAAGGDVTLIAGGDVTSVLPGNKGYYYAGNFFAPLNSTYSTAGAGAFGRQAGNVTVVAGGNVTGNYMVANGIGNIFAGVKMDANGNPIKDGFGKYMLGTLGSAGTSAANPNLALSLVSGGWNVTAAQNIILQEVRNPNGIFDLNAGAAYKHLFDYAPGDYVNLSAGNLVQLGASASSLPRVDALKVPVVYPSILNVTAGAGGVTFIGDSFYNQLILFSSPQGSLTINTTAGGSLVSKLPNVSGVPQIFNLIVSDSGKNQFKFNGDFGLNDHAATPVHLNNPTPIVLNISGNMSLVLIGAPEAAQITVGGNMNNSRFQGMNLAASDVTSIHVLGDINNRSTFTSVNLNQSAGTAAPDLSYLSQALSSNPSAITLASSFYYDPVTKIMTYQNIAGQTVANILQLVQNLTVQVYLNGVPQWVDALQTIPLTKTVSIMNAATAQALLTKYNLDNAVSGLASGVGPPDSTTGFIFGGGGKLDISARNIDLGTTAGIQSVGAGLYQIGSSSPLANLFNKGADVSVTTTGDINLFSSSIASLNGGNLYINAGGTVNVGSPNFIDSSIGARGIYSTSGSDVAVYANKDINLNGSRIAAFDGGNVTVESFNGDINAGVGGLGGVTLTAYYVDPTTHTLYQNSSVAFGSGILAETAGPRSGSPNYHAPDAILGNVLVETPNGNINANKAGVLQLAFNQLNYPAATVEVLAGYELRDSNGHPLTARELANGTPVLVSANRNIDASNSGIIAQNAILKATGNITGAIFAKGNTDVAAVNNVNVTVLALGNANVSAGGTLSGTIVGIGGITASGSSVDASLLSNGAISGATSGQSGFAQGTAASATSQADQNQDAAKTADSGTGDDTDEQNKKKKPITLAQKVSRVTVLLPTKTN